MHAVPATRMQIISEPPALFTCPLQNSLRHSLSLGHYFRKYNSDKLVTKKGHLWEVDPQRAAELDKEMYMFLAKGLPGMMQLSYCMQAA